MDRRVNWKHWGIVACLALTTIVAVPYLTASLYVPPPPLPAKPIVELPRQVAQHLEIRAGDSMDAVLERADLDQDTRQDMLRAFNKAFDVRKVRADRDLLLSHWEPTGEVASLEYTIDSDHKLMLSRSNGVSSAEVTEIPGAVREVAVCATLQDSLAATMDHAGESFLLAMMMADVLAFDIDFYRDPQLGDDFCLLVEKKFYDNGQPPTYRRVLGARYNNHGAISDAYYFAGSNEKGSFYGGKGESLKSAFLRSPLEFDAHVSSHFSMNRLHPVLHTVRAHYGTDYAAPTGTPVRAVADGTVVGAGDSGGVGQYGDYPALGRLSNSVSASFADLAHVGQKIAQGAHLGLVGMTGLATGPHLDIRISRNGKYLNWERLRSPRSVSLEGALKETFVAERDRMRGLMDAAFKHATVTAAVAGR